MSSLTFTALWQVFQDAGTYQEAIKHSLSAILRAGDDQYLPVVADHLDKAAAASSQQQADAEIQAALQTLEQATGSPGNLGLGITPAPPMGWAALRSLPPADKQRGYYVAALLWTVTSLLSRHLGQRERSEQAGEQAVLMLQSYGETVQAHLKKPTIHYPPSIGGASPTGKSKLSLPQILNQEQNALHKILTQWLGTNFVKALITRARR